MPERSGRVLGFEKCFLLVLCIVMYVTPGIYVGHWAGKRGWHIGWKKGGLAEAKKEARIVRKKYADLYVTLKTVFAMAALYFGWSGHLLVLVAAYLLADTFLYLTGIVFLHKYWQNQYSSNRSLLLSICNFIEYTCWFACFYLFSGTLQPPGNFAPSVSAQSAESSAQLALKTAQSAITASQSAAAYADAAMRAMPSGRMQTQPNMASVPSAIAYAQSAAAYAQASAVLAQSAAGSARIATSAPAVSVATVEPMDAFYFSVITATTIGFGDLTPTTSLGRRLVTLEALLSLFFIATVLSKFVANLGQAEKDKEATNSV